MDDEQTILLLEQLYPHMRHRAIARGGVVQLARMRLGVVHQLAQGFGRHRGVHRQHVRRDGQHAYGGKVAQRIPAEVVKHRRVAHMEHRVAHQQVVAIGRSARHGSSRDVATGTGFVVHHHALAQTLRHRRDHHAGHRIQNAPWGHGYYQSDWAVGKGGLRPRRIDKDEQAK